jgi:DNA-binding XRE family transcriptional regulator
VSNSPLSSFAEDFKAFRVALGMSQFDLAKRLGCHPQTIYRWENENRQPKSKYLPILERLAKEKGVAPPDFSKIR